MRRVKKNTAIYPEYIMTKRDGVYEGRTIDPMTGAEIITVTGLKRNLEEALYSVMIFRRGIWMEAVPGKQYEYIDRIY